jgi:hypothetical protein
LEKISQEEQLTAAMQGSVDDILAATMAECESLVMRISEFSN